MSNTESFADIFTNGPYNNLQQISDATLKSKDGKIFNIHRMILAPKSEYFRANFTFNNNSKEFSLKGIESHILEQVLIFLYTNELSLKLEHIKDLLFAADFLLIDKLTSKCSSFVIQNLDIPNCLTLLKVSRHHNNKVLFQHCYRFTQLHFQDVMKNDVNNIGPLDMEVLKMLLAEKSLNIYSEETIWDAISTWINYDLAGRLEFVPEMLTYLNIKNLDEDIAENIITSVIVSENEHCKEINEYKSMVMSYLTILKHHMLIHCHPIFAIDQARLPSFLNVIVRKSFKKETNIELLITFDEKIDTYQKICNLDSFPTDSLIFGNKLHLYRHICDNNIPSWDFVENKMTTISYAITSRFSNYAHCVVFSNGMIYGMQNYYLNNELAEVTVECYNPEVDKWTSVASMYTMHIDSLISCCDEVYAFGYTSTTDMINIRNMLAQKYNQETDTWSLIALPSIQRSGSAVARYNNKLLLIGGKRTENSVPQLIDEYDPVTNSWSPMPKLPVSYCNPKIANVDNDLYIYEGDPVINGDLIVPPVFWNEENQNWQIVTETSSFFNLENFRFFTIYDPGTVKRIIFNRKCQKWSQSSLFK